jgi:PEGA domain
MVRQSRLVVLLMLLTTMGLARPPEAAAQRVASPRGVRTGVAVPRTTYAPRYYRPYYYPRYHYPYAYSRFYYPYYPYYSSFAFSFGFGWPGPYWGAFGYPHAYPYGYPYAYSYPYYWYDNTGSARLQITPRNAQVYVDGRFVGLVDDFDGSFQRLHLEPGEHELQVYLEGHRTLTQNVLFTRGTTVNLRGALEPLRPGEAAQPKPEPTRAARPPDAYDRQSSAPSYRTGEPGAYGTLSLRVNPADAGILIDGEPWDRPQGEDRFSIDLAEGPHQVEVRKEGYRPYVRTVDVRRGRIFTLNVSLTPGGQGLLQATRRSGAPVAQTITLRQRSGPTQR